jgi:putative DNA primase/helicase
VATNINSGSTGEVPRVQPGSQQSSAELKLKSAVRCAERGWHVIPLTWIEGGDCSCSAPDCSSPGKHPLTTHGVKDASNDKAVIRAWWRMNPQANVGIVTGAQSGITVLDIDPRHGGRESLRALEEQYGPLPQGPCVQTGGDGEHRYFLHPGPTVKNKVGLAPGIDIRGDGGYVVGPRSNHTSGQLYLWKPGHRPADFTMAIEPGGTGTAPTAAGPLECH